MARSRLALPLLVFGLVLLVACCANAGSSSSDSSDSPESSDSSESHEHRSRKHSHSHVNVEHGHRYGEAEVTALLRSIVFKKPAVVTYDVTCNERNGGCNEISNDFRR
ncbi:uncharacterized protein LOC126475406 isoform X1 [Schistocerca serialis cubense]|uniref:uncharacterized protein LOC126475406 isoform X1 n=1 Tax=Schistocerca serialis cubense TaxID=2023355 RepID=UPI00214EE1D1|nr:uncharacterized protein LOC126475406 isoform X1 [Schistocerca serialis cubense]